MFNVQYAFEDYFINLSPCARATAATYGKYMYLVAMYCKRGINNFFCFFCLLKLVGRSPRLLCECEASRLECMSPKGLLCVVTYMYVAIGVFILTSLPPH